MDDAVLLQDGATSHSVSSGKRHSAVIQSLKRALRDHPEEIYAVMEKRMLDDFGAAEESPGAPTRSGTFRGWAEHRSRIPNIPATVRTVWGITGALDALRSNRVAEGKARLILLLAQIDQLAVDRGQPILASEGSLEDAPPFSSFGKHVPPDIYESQHTKLWPATWAEAFMWKIKELDDFVERRQKLGKRNQWVKPDANPTGQPKADPKKKPAKGGGKGGKNQDATGGGGSSLLFKPVMHDMDAEPDPDFNPQMQFGAGQDVEFDASAPPGSRASTVHPGAWWGSSFRFCMKLGSSFGQLLGSFHKKPSSSSNGRGTVTFWPMPLPYPKVFKQGISGEVPDLKQMQFQKGVNLAVACLDWLHLRRPARCPEEICLFQPLSKVQWRIVKFIEEVMVAWSVCSQLHQRQWGDLQAKWKTLKWHSGVWLP